MGKIWSSYSVSGFTYFPLNSDLLLKPKHNDLWLTTNKILMFTPNFEERDMVKSMSVSFSFNKKPQDYSMLLYIAVLFFRKLLVYWCTPTFCLAVLFLSPQATVCLLFHLILRRELQNLSEKQKLQKKHWSCEEQTRLRVSREISSQNTSL